jgi:hypothetical protein
MSTLSVSDPNRTYRQDPNERYETYQPMRYADSRGTSKGWLLAGAGAVALAAFAAYYFGPDFARYVKMERM